MTFWQFTKKSIREATYEFFKPLLSRGQTLRLLQGNPKCVKEAEVD